MADGAFGHPGPIAQGHAGQEFRAQRDHAITQSKLSAQSFLTFYSRSLCYYDIGNSFVRDYYQQVLQPDRH